MLQCLASVLRRWSVQNKYEPATNHNDLPGYTEIWARRRDLPGYSWICLSGLFTGVNYPTRTAKSGGDWTFRDLHAFNISIVDQPFATFFDTPDLPDLPTNLRAFADTPNRAAAAQAADIDTYKLLYYLELATFPKIGLEPAVDSFAEKLLETIGYAPGYRITLSHQFLPLECAGRCTTRVDVFVCDLDNIIYLLVQHDRGIEDLSDPEPPLIAAALTAYQRNNNTRVRELRLPALDEITFPGITLVGTFPTFYKIRVTAALNTAVICADYPLTATIVDRYIPRIPHDQSEGMTPVDSREVILRHFEAFKRFVV
ncbi:hypothetical protein A0H81_02782 [Grifola frondosa]|uniref:Uncharacterized protein n=1 Tax=Grifola frondosa TaxID=5627 RepID=A0A1C7MLB3_GRIFR|nr:hypothetical protein A0H81_02782 [Grifola frondosa]